MKKLLNPNVGLVVTIQTKRLYDAFSLKSYRQLPIFKKAGLGNIQTDWYFHVFTVRTEGTKTIMDEVTYLARDCCIVDLRFVLADWIKELSMEEPDGEFLEMGYVVSRTELDTETLYSIVDNAANIEKLSQSGDILTHSKVKSG